MSKLLLVEDDETIVENLCVFLQQEGFLIESVFGQKQAIELLEEKYYDLVLLDISLADGNGFAICSYIKQNTDIPVIFLTASGDEYSVVTGLDMGADDYITKPFGTGELMARIRTSLRHSHSLAPGHMYKALDLEIDFEKRLIRLRGEEVHLTQIEYQLLTLLAENSGRVLTYSYIMNAIWGPYMDNNNQILRVNMANIRRKLEQNPAQPQYVFTEIGVGYRMRENENVGTV